MEAAKVMGLKGFSDRLTDTCLFHNQVWIHWVQQPPMSLYASLPTTLDPPWIVEGLFFLAGQLPFILQLLFKAFLFSTLSK